MIGRPYWAMFAAHFQLMLQYRAAAIAGFATQCWWGAIKIMILAAFYAGAAAAAPMTLANAVTYTWLAQAFLVIQPWGGDPEVSEMVRSGAVGYERLRPVDTYALWYAKACASMIARVAPRAALMVAVSAVILPLVGLGAWRLRLPASPEAALWFAASLAAAVLLSASIRQLITITVVSTMTDRGPNTLASPIAGILSGGIVPLAFFPDAARQALRLNPYAGIVDTPFRIYFADLSGLDAAAGIALQLGWALALGVLGWWWLGRAMTRLQMQGG